MQPQHLCPTFVTREISPALLRSRLSRDTENCYKNNLQLTYKTVNMNQQIHQNPTKMCLLLSHYLTRLMGCFPNLLNLFHIRLRERAHKKVIQRVIGGTFCLLQSDFFTISQYGFL